MSMIERFRKPRVTHIVITHEVSAKGNLDLILRGMNWAVNRLADAIGGGLHAIALALSTKEDNSAEIRELAAKVKSVREKLQTSVDNQQEGE